MEFTKTHRKNGPDVHSFTGSHRPDTPEEIVKLRDALSCLLFSTFILMMKIHAQAGEIHGRVVSANGGEPLRQVQVSLVELKRATVTKNDGFFNFGQVPPGRYTLRASAVGYRLLTILIEFGNGGQDADKEISITLVPDFRRTDVVDVKGEVFHTDNPAVASQFDLNAEEIKEASTVLADDPLRSVQALPGVAPSDNNDFFGQFTVLGAPFSNISIYVDDILVPAPFHGIPNQNDGASLSVFNSETLDSLDLMPVAFPVRYADSTGAALLLRTREGSRSRPTFTLAAGLTDSNVIGEGEIGSDKKGSWLISGRKSYLDYLVHSINGGQFTDGNFEDGSARLSYDLAANQNLSFFFLDGHTDVNNGAASTPEDLSSGGNDVTLARLGWRVAATPRLLFDTDAAYIRNSYEIRNLAGQILQTDYYGEWVAGTRASWSWTKNQVLEAGFTGRRLRDSGYSQDFGSGNPSVVARADATGTRFSGYAQQVSSLFSNRLHVMAGVRWDEIEQVGTQPLSGEISAAFQVEPRAQLQFGVGRYAQFDSFQHLALGCPAPFTLPAELYQRSDHLTAAVERRLGEYTRIRVEAFDRENHVLGGGRVPLADGSCGPVVAHPNPPLLASFFSPLRDYSRGVQFVIQRRSANRLSGWIGYTLDYARQRVPETIFQISPPVVFEGPLVTEPTTEDQRYTLNAFATYRLTPSIDIGGKWLYGSGFPVPGDSVFTVGNTLIALGNQTRLGDYQRLDLRLEKSWAYTRWKLTLYAEVLNVTNHNNPRFIFTSFQSNGQPVGGILPGLPITPTAGLVFQF